MGLEAKKEWDTDKPLILATNTQTIETEISTTINQSLEIEMVTMARYVCRSHLACKWWETERKTKLMLSRRPGSLEPRQKTDQPSLAHQGP